MCYVSWDPECRISDHPVPFEVDLSQPSAGRKRPEREGIFTDHQVQNMLRKLDPDGLDYDGWLKVGMALEHGEREGKWENGFRHWDRWSARGAKYKKEEMRAKWNSFDSECIEQPVTWNYLLKVTNTSTHGGKREGAGRKRINESNDPAGDLADFCWETGNFALISGVHHQYKKEEGIWRPLPTRDAISAAAIQYLGAAGINPEHKVRLAAGKALGGIMELEDTGRTHLSPSNLWPFKSFVMDQVTEENRDYRPTDFFQNKLDYEPEKCEHIPSSLERWWSVAFQGHPGVARHALRCLAHGLFDRNQFQKIFILSGVPGSGKSVIVSLLGSMLGPKSCLEISESAAWAGKQETYCGAENARILMVSEANRGLPPADLKSLRGGDEMAVRQLYGQTYRFSYQGHIIMVSNKALSMGQAGMSRRVEVIPFSGTPEKADPYFLDKLIGERPVIWTYLRDLWLMDVKDKDWKRPDEVECASEEVTKGADTSIESWVEDCLRPIVKGQQTKFADLVQSYLTHAYGSAQALTGKDLENVKRRLRSAFPAHNIQRVPGGGRGKYICEIIRNKKVL